MDTVEYITIFGAILLQSLYNSWTNKSLERIERRLDKLENKTEVKR